MGNMMVSANYGVALERWEVMRDGYLMAGASGYLMANNGAIQKPSVHNGARQG
jgi:hypothetical protein